MGPAATIHLYQQITARTPVTREQDHLALIIDSDPSTPDRTEALRSGGPSPERHLIAAARRLERAGAELIAIACNTAHAWYEAVAEAVSVPVLNLIDVTAEAASTRCRPGGTVGLLASTGTVQTGLYQRACQARRLGLIVPDQHAQQQVMELIGQVKQGCRLAAAAAAARQQAEALAAAGADAIIVGCTDISVLLREGDVSKPVIDSTAALAEKIIAKAR